MMWKNNEFDQMLQEAIRCDRSLRNTHKGDIDDHHIVRVFTRLMLNGKVRAAIRWLSEKGRGKKEDSLICYGPHNERLHESVASLCHRLANSIVLWAAVRGLIASCLITLDKCPGVHPVGIGEALRRVVGKAIYLVTRFDPEEVCGVTQLCARFRDEIEGAVHALNELFEENREDGWRVLIMDAANAFNSLNRIAALQNVRVLWLRCSRFLFNSYRGWAALVVRGSESFLYSKEGVTQRDPLSMFMYAVSFLPLISSLDHLYQLTQVWYADDASACGNLDSSREWFYILKERGPTFGYFPEPSKSFLVVYDEQLSRTTDAFSGLDINVVCSRRLLRGVIGNTVGRIAIVETLIKQWISELECLTMIASTQPQALFAAFTKSLQFRWAYVQRVIPNCRSLFNNLQCVIWEKFCQLSWGERCFTG